MTFVMRKLDQLPQTLGEKLRALRRGQAVSLAMLEETTHIQRKYLGWQIRGLLEPPMVVLDTPSDGMYANSAMLDVEGLVLEDDVTLRINGEEVVISDDNRFQTMVDLSRGLNVITVEAERRYSRTAVIYRRVVFDAEQTTPISLN